MQIKQIGMQTKVRQFQNSRIQRHAENTATEETTQCSSTRLCVVNSDFCSVLLEEANPIMSIRFCPPQRITAEVQHGHIQQIQPSVRCFNHSP